MAISATPTMKKFLNDPNNVVRESLEGLAAAHGDLLRFDEAAQIVVRRDAPVSGKVGLVSGGGSGHEPLHGGFVGAGMLDAACPGEVFTSPVPDQMIAATKAVDGGAGVVHLVKNYTGDVLNFKMAAEDVADDGIEVESVLTDDDVAVQDSLYTAGRRGVGATVLVEKIAGAAAERRDDLRAVADVARHVNDRARSFGVALSSCTPPAAGKPMFDLPDGEMEVGIGIHGEPGRRREHVRSAHEIVEEMLDAVLSDLRPSEGAKVLAFVNGMGGTPLIELYLLYNEFDRQLRAAAVEPARNLVGSYITSLEMAGASITLLELDDELTRLWDAPVHTPALRWEREGTVITEHSVRAQTIITWLNEVEAQISAQGDYLTQLDAAIGDGDHGTNMNRGFVAVGKALSELQDGTPPGRLLTLAGKTLVSTVGGASGPLWGTALRRAGRSLGDAESFDGEQLADALDAAIEGIVELGAAAPGDKTMIDALTPGAAALHAGLDAEQPLDDALEAAAKAAREGADATVPMQAHKGRASYLGERSIGHLDPGAVSSSIILEALAEAVRRES